MTMDAVAVHSPAKVFLHYLDRLHGMLVKVAQFDADISSNALHPTMLPLLQQAKTAIGFSLRTCCPLAGRTIAVFGDDLYNFDSVFAQLAATVDYLSAIPDAEFGRFEELRVETVAGSAELNLAGWDYYQLYALPNFFFHYTMVYAVARQAGVDLGKGDFDGFHQYPSGFSFVDTRSERGA